MMSTTTHSSTAFTAPHSRHTTTAPRGKKSAHQQQQAAAAAAAAAAATAEQQHQQQQTASSTTSKQLYTAVLETDKNCVLRLAVHSIRVFYIYTRCYRPVPACWPLFFIYLLLV